MTIGIGAAPLSWPVEAQVFSSDQVFGWSFGRDLALEGDTLIVGADGAEPPGGNSQGAAYIFARDGSDWVEQVKLVAFDAVDFARFGAAVDISGDRVVVGARGQDIGGEDGQGAAYVYLRVGDEWRLEQQLLASDGDSIDLFGSDVAIDGEVIAVGAESEEGAITESFEGCQGSGAAYVFELQDGTWVETAKVFDEMGQCSDNYGQEIDVQGDTLIVGAPLASIDGAFNRGAAYVYRKLGGGWPLEQKIGIADWTAGDHLGSAVALDRDVALVGAEERPIAGNFQQGAAFVFKRTGATWLETQELTASDGQEDSEFGSALALRGGMALIMGEIGINGYVYEFREQGGVWQEIQSMRAPEDPQSLDFGISISLGESRAVIGHGANTIPPPGGSAWVYLRPTLFSDGFESGDTAAWDVTGGQ